MNVSNKMAKMKINKCGISNKMAKKMKMNSKYEK